MRRRTFLTVPIAFAAFGACGLQVAHAASAGAPTSTRIPISFSKMRVGARPVWLDIDRMDPGDVSIEVDLWLRVDADPPPVGGVLIKPRIRVIEDSRSGRRPILNSIDLGGKSAPKTSEIHITGKSDGLSHDDVFRPLGLEFSIYQAYVYTPAQQAGTTVSTVAGKDSFIIVTSK